MQDRPLDIVKGKADTAS